jgi:hypothetical protein
MHYPPHDRQDRAEDSLSGTIGAAQNSPARPGELRPYGSGARNGGIRRLKMQSVYHEVCDVGVGRDRAPGERGESVPVIAHSDHLHSAARRRLGALPLSAGLCSLSI